MKSADRELVAARVEAPLRNEGSTPHVPVITINANRRVFARARELWEYRELLYFLMWRDVKVRYKQTVIGVAWAVIQPLVTLVIFTIIFGRLARIPSEGLPYPVFAYAGLLPWHLFAGGLQRSIQSLVSGAPLITKVYFPRLIVPLASTFSATIDFAIAFVVLVLMAVGSGLMPTWRLIALPGSVGLTLLSALGVGLWLSALNVRYRDVGHAVPFLIQIWMYASPVVYPAALVPERWRLLYSLNPMVGAVEGFRWALLGKPVPDLQTVVASTGVAFLLLIWGLAYFRHMERTFADVI
jgi:lipopolysaccharide transport system permease protein